MPRHFRLFLAGATYHVYCRVARGEFVFDDDVEAIEFIEALQGCHVPHCFNVMHGCHVHHCTIVAFMGDIGARGNFLNFVRHIGGFRILES